MDIFYLYYKNIREGYPDLNYLSNRSRYIYLFRESRVEQLMANVLLVWVANTASNLDLYQNS